MLNIKKNRDSKSIQYLKEIVAEIMDIQVPDNISKFNLILNLREKKDRILIKNLLKIRLPDINKVELNYFNNKSSVLKDFLSNSFPCKVNCFAINKSYGKDMLDIEEYIDSLRYPLKNVIEIVSFRNIKFTNKVFSKVITSCGNIETLIFEDSLIDCSDDFDFTLCENYRTQTIVFKQCKSLNGLHWGTDIDSFEKIIIGIANSNFKNSLKSLEVITCGLSKPQILEKLNKHNISGIKICDK